MTANGVTKTFHYDGDLVAYVTQSDGKVYRFAYDHSGRPIFMSYNNNQYWYHYDNHGNVIRMTNSDGNTIAKYKYDAWGNITYQWGTTGTGSEIVNLNPYRYSVYWYDSEIDKYYLKARYYDAEIGRFLAKDPIAVRVGESLSLNAYTYAGNNPINAIDLEGEWVWYLVIGAYYAWSIYDTYKDVQTLTSPSVSLNEKVVTGGFLAASFIPFGKVLKVGKYTDDFIEGVGTTKRIFNITKQESDIWKGFDNVKGMPRKSSGSGKNKRYYEWDNTHNDIEVYDSNGKHLGSMDPTSGEIYKGPVKGRTIKL